MDEIARTARVSRPLLYKMFGTKADLLKVVQERELARFHDHFSSTLRLEGPAGPLMVERLVQGVEMALSDEFAVSMLDYDQLKSDPLSEPEMWLAAEGRFWLPLFGYAKERGELRDEVDPQEALRWLLFLLEMILRRFHEFFGSTEALRRFIEVYIVPALVKTDVVRRPAVDGTKSSSHDSRRQ
jgi:AcrR family transcriptional regulator